MGEEERMPQLFCVWAGEGGKYADAFVSGEYVGIEWDIGGLNQLGSLGEIRMRVRAAYPDEPHGRINNYVGSINGFIHRIRIGDFILTPTPGNKLLHIGEVISYPFKVLNLDESCPHPYRRKVEWPAKVWRSELSKPIQRSLTSSRPVFRIKDGAPWIEENMHDFFPPGWEDRMVGPGTRIPSPVEVEAREGYRIWLRYDDGASGEVDLSHLAGKGVFAAWNNRAFFESVHLDDNKAIVWNEELDLCPDALYMDITGKTVEELMPGLRGSHTNA